MNNGVLVIDKPDGMTSHDVVGRVRKILRTKAVGHTGTLDPFATGVLVILVGKATRLAQFLDKAEKEYEATIRFGYQTDTGDHTGSRTAECGLLITEIDQRLTVENIERALEELRGEIWQTPPMFSAKKIAGKKLYELARRGETVERRPVKINVFKLEKMNFDNGESLQFNEDETVDLRIQTVCSAGTYIRVLAEDLGAKLGVEAHLAKLRRTRAGIFDLSQAVTLENLESLAFENALVTVFISPNQALSHLPSVAIDQSQVRQTLHGKKICIQNQNFVNNEFVRMSDEKENLVAIGVFDKDAQAVQPRVVLQTKD